MPTQFAVQASEPDNYYGYRQYKKGKFEFRRDEYFVHIRWPKGTHTMAADVFLRALQRDKEEAKAQRAKARAKASR